MGYTAAVRPAWESPNHPSPVEHPPQNPLGSGLVVLNAASTAPGHCSLLSCSGLQTKAWGSSVRMEAARAPACRQLTRQGPRSCPFLHCVDFPPRHTPSFSGPHKTPSPQIQGPQAIFLTPVQPEILVPSLSPSPTKTLTFLPPYPSPPFSVRSEDRTHHTPHTVLRPRHPAGWDGAVPSNLRCTLTLAPFCLRKPFLRPPPL